MIRIEDLRVVKKNKTILSGINLQINQGEKILIKGESGSGKSTFVKSLLFFENFNGQIYFENNLIAEKNLFEFRRQIGYIGQIIPQFDSNVEDFINFPFKYRANKDIKPSKDRLCLLLDRLNFNKDIITEKFSYLSEGEKQRILIVQILLLAKPVYIFDEITSALDRKNIKAVVSLVTEDSHRTIISIAHHQEWHERCSRVLKINKGRIISDRSK